MRAGRLRDSITIQREQEVTLDDGSIRRLWVDYAKDVPSEITTPSENQQISNNQPKIATGYSIRIRFLEGVNATMRVVLPEGDMLSITGVIDPTRRRAEMVISATQTTPNK